jgi:hypothetical protein
MCDLFLNKYGKCCQVIIQHRHLVKKTHPDVSARSYPNTHMNEIMAIANNARDELHVLAKFKLDRFSVALEKADPPASSSSSSARSANAPASAYAASASSAAPPPFNTVWQQVPQQPMFASGSHGFAEVPQRPQPPPPPPPAPAVPPVPPL